jgi:hypothetical protein
MFRASETGFGYRPLRQMILSPAKAGQTEFGLQPFPPISFRFNPGGLRLAEWVADVVTLCG